MASWSNLRCSASAIAPQLEAGRAFALAWHKAKEREGLVDFDDLIARAATLLSDTAMADWIRYKLDRSFDHILVDEAQDTNAAQWAIVKALTDDYFDGEGAQGAVQVERVQLLGGRHVRVGVRAHRRGHRAPVERVLDALQLARPLLGVARVAQFAPIRKVA